MSFYVKGTSDLVHMREDMGSGNPEQGKLKLSYLIYRPDFLYSSGIFFILSILIFNSSENLPIQQCERYKSPKGVMIAEDDDDPARWQI